MSKKFGSNSKSTVTGRSIEVQGDFTRALRVWSKKMQDSGIMRELKERMHHEPNCIANTRKRKAARKRWEKKVETMISNGQWHQDKPY